MSQSEISPAIEELDAVEADGSLIATTVTQRCELCGNDYEKAFRVVMHGVVHTFDSFECAIARLAPTCVHCKCRIIGHGMEQDSQMFCCAHCAAASGVQGMRDRA
jgi:hypothetical protein